MTKAELIAYAERRGIDSLEAGMTKRDMIREIRRRT